MRTIRLCYLIFVYLEKKITLIIGYKCVYGWPHKITTWIVIASNHTPHTQSLICLRAIEFIYGLSSSKNNKKSNIFYRCITNCTRAFYNCIARKQSIFSNFFFCCSSIPFCFTFFLCEVYIWSIRTMGQWRYYANKIQKELI